MMNYKKLALTVAAGAMATTMMAQSAPQLNATNIEKYINGISTKTRVDWTDLKNNHDTLAGKKKLLFCVL